MSRSGYIDDDYDQWQHIKWRGQVASAVRGKRGQSFLHELIEALDAMPEKRLIAHDLVKDAPAFVPPELSTPQVCAIGSVGVRRSIDLTVLDPDNPHEVGEAFGIAHQLAAEIVFMNDEAGPWKETPEDRWQRMRDWAVQHLKVETP